MKKQDTEKIVRTIEKHTKDKDLLTHEDIHVH